MSLGIGSGNAANTSFDVLGVTTANVSSLVEKGKVKSAELTRSASASVAGTGQLASTNAAAVLKGSVTLGGGKHEVK